MPAVVHAVGFTHDALVRKSGSLKHFDRGFVGLLNYGINAMQVQLDESEPQNELECLTGVTPPPEFSPEHVTSLGVAIRQVDISETNATNDFATLWKLNTEVVTGLLARLPETGIDVFVGILQ